jgi:hypothetical protein
MHVCAYYASHKGTSIRTTWPVHGESLTPLYFQKNFTVSGTPDLLTQLPVTAPIRERLSNHRRQSLTLISASMPPKSRKHARKYRKKPFKQFDYESQDEETRAASSSATATSNQRKAGDPQQSARGDQQPNEEPEALSPNRAVRHPRPLTLYHMPITVGGDVSRSIRT